MRIITNITGTAFLHGELDAYMQTLYGPCRMMAYAMQHILRSRSPHDMHHVRDAFLAMWRHHHVQRL
jgi:hypothetical protein